MLTNLSVAGYRSLYDIALAIGQVVVVVGPNGCGKSNLYRALRLLQHAADGSFARALADEGGLPSALWAGARHKSGAHKSPVRLTIGTTVDDFLYELSTGLPSLNDLPDPFRFDPILKEESLRYSDARGKTVQIMERTGQSVWARDDKGVRQMFPLSLGQSESVLAGLRAGQRFPHLSALRETMLGWRFYHQFRTDAESPVRREQVGVFTPVLAHDGSDLAAALATVRAVGQAEDLDDAVDRAFSGASLVVNVERDNRFSVGLQMPGVLRALSATELSDGTLRYFCLLAALLSPRPPSLLALNEPETSLHPDLLPPLAQLIAKMSEQSQIWVTTHSATLANAISEQTGHAPIRLALKHGATILEP